MMVEKPTRGWEKTLAVTTGSREAIEVHHTKKDCAKNAPETVSAAHNSKV